MKKQKRIWVTDDITRTLKAESGLSSQAVLMALKFASYSDAAKNIRTRAIELMDKTQEINRELMKSFHE